MSDNGMPVGGIEEYWETPQTLNETWGYNRFDERWKSATEVIHRLVAIVSQGGNYLLNVGPTGEGVIPDTSVQILNEVGDWMQKYHQSIYGTTASPFPRLPWGWCTVKGDKLFLHILNWPSDDILQLPGLHNNVVRAFFMRDSTRRLEVHRSRNDLTIELAGHRDMMDVHNTVIVLRIEGTPRVDPVIVAQAPDGTIRLDYVTARTDGEAVKRFNRKGKFHISKMQDGDDTIEWSFDVSEAGRFFVEITYAAIPAWQKQPYSITVGQQILPAEVESTGDWYEYKSFRIGRIDLTTGKHKLALAPTEELSNYLMYFSDLRLIPE
jgi:alpha-L-fucosidase